MKLIFTDNRYFLFKNENEDGFHPSKIYGLKRNKKTTYLDSKYGGIAVERTGKKDTTSLTFPALYPDGVKSKE